MKYGKERVKHEWVKAHIMCGMKTNIITDGKLFLVAYGVIEYEDVFDIPDKSHKSGFFFYYAYGNPTSHGFQTYYSALPDYLQVT